MKAIFLDRDGTVIIDKHYLYKPSEVEYFSDTFKALKILQEKKYQLFIVTNQSGVGRGYFELSDVYAVHDKMQHDLLSHHLLPFQDIQISPAHPDENSPCRKPSPLMLKSLAERWNIDMKQSYMVGDKLSDAQAGRSAGCQGVLVRQAYLRNHNDFPFYKDLMSFANSVT